MDNVFFFDVNLKWEHNHLAELASTKVNHTIKVSSAPEFTGELPGKWTAEHLFLGALCSCYMSAFLMQANSAGLKFKSFGCDALGRVEKHNEVYSFTEIILKPVVKIFKSTDQEKTNRLLEKAETNCIIANSIKTKIERFVVIKVAEEHVE